MKVTKNGSIRWASLLGIYKCCFEGKYLGFEHIRNRIWKVFLGFFDEKYLRNKNQSTRLETILV